MGKINVTDRLTFLAKNFDIIETDEESINKKIEELKGKGYHSNLVTSIRGNILGLLSVKTKEYDKEVETIKSVKKVCISIDVFSAMIAADPTENKMYIQWMLTLFTRLLKDDNTIQQAIRFADEDLPQANQYLTLFDAHKRKKKFKLLCENNFIVKNITDVGDINQYKSLAQLFDVVDPFIERDPSEMEKLLNRFVNSGQAIIPVKDRKFTLYIPLSRDASVVFDKFANWCTAKVDNGMFKNYTENYKKPNGKKSDIYIIINNKFFEGNSEELYQVHFESGQIRNRKNDSDISIFENVINNSEGLSNFFYEELIVMAKENKKGLDNNQYLDYLVKFGFTESLFDLIDENTPSIKFMNREIPKLPDMSKFKNLDQLIICNAKLVEIHPSIGKLENIDMLSLSDNLIKSIPKEISMLKKLDFINLAGNPLTDIPEELKYLDKSNGGSLKRFGLDKAKVSEEVYNKIKKLLPNVLI